MTKPKSGLHLGPVGENAETAGAPVIAAGALDTATPGLDTASAVFSEEYEEDEFPEDWEAQGTLDAPTPRPGHTQHWVRMAILGQSDAKNLASRSHQGWRPRRVETVPEGERRRFPVFRDGRLGDIIMREGLILCEMPNRLVEKRNAHYRSKHERQLSSLNDRIAEQNEGGGHGITNMHIAERKSTVGISPQTHSGRKAAKPTVAAD